MANVLLNAPLDMSGDFVYFDTVIDFGPTSITATSAGGYVTTVYGSFSFDLFGNVSGTLTGLEQYQNNVLQVQITDANVDAAVASDAIDAGSREALIDIVFGGNDSFTGSTGSDVLFASMGRDTMRGNGGRDVLYGEEGNDKLWGGAGNDKLFGGNGADRLWGGGGRDVLKGGAKADRLVGDAGNDKLSGGGGRDTFVFNANHSDTDRILDFNAAKDVIEIQNATANDVSVSTANGNTAIDVGDATIILRGVLLDEGDIDFAFV